jgi:peptidoglycan-associated lipoprotein
MKRILTVVLATAILAACSSTPTKEQDGAAVEDRSGSTSAPPASSKGPTTTPMQPKAVTGDPLKDPSNVLSKRSIYFELDSNIVKEEFKPLVAAHARYLQQNRGQKMTVQGNADERGSREYNLALGQRRADAVKQMMTLLGAQGDQIETVSFGEEKPKSAGHDEASWSENRRADLAYPND